MNTDESLSPTALEELPWLAFLYVSEELTPDDVVDFEERLLTDQAAREAVAQATKISEGLWMANAMDSLNASAKLPAVESAQSDGQSGQARRFSRRSTWIGSTVIAAGLAFCVGWWFANQHNAQSPKLAQSPAQPEGDVLGPDDLAGAEQLVGIWSDSQSLVAELAAGPFLDDLEASDEASLRESHEPEAFSWMLTVVSAAPSASTQVMEN